MVHQLGYPVNDGCPLQPVVAAVHAAPDPEWPAVVDLVAVTEVVGLTLARKAISTSICSGKLKESPDLVIGLMDLG